MNDVTQSLYAIPGKWLHELLALCGPEDHELRERIRAALAAAPQELAGLQAAPVAWASCETLAALEHHRQVNNFPAGGMVLVPVAAPVVPPEPVSTYIEVLECSDCGHIGINDADGSKAACNTCEWQGDSPIEDKCPGCNAVGTMTSACPKCGARTSLIAETNLLAGVSAPAAPAPVVLPEPAESTAPTLRAMALNYTPGHSWDHLDADACLKGAAEIDRLRALLAQAAAPAAPAVDAETIHLQDLKNAIADCKELRQQVRLLDEQQAGSVWRWQADAQDQLETMGNNMGVLIRACDLRVLLAGGVSMETAPTVDALDAKDRECIAIGRTIQRAAGELPVDGEIRIDIENGAGAVYVLEPKHGDWRYIDSSDVLSAQINAAIDAANAAAKGAA